MQNCDCTPGDIKAHELEERVEQLDVGLLSNADLAALSRHVDTLLVSATTAGELRRKLDVLRRNGSADWQLLRAPAWIGDRLVAVVWKPALITTADLYGAW